MFFKFRTMHYVSVLFQTNSPKGNKSMKVKDLIEALANVNPDADVFVWDAGNRLGLVSVDTSFLNDEYIDLNTDTDSD